MTAKKYGSHYTCIDIILIAYQPNMYVPTHLVAEVVVFLLEPVVRAKVKESWFLFDIWYTVWVTALFLPPNSTQQKYIY